MSPSEWRAWNAVLLALLSLGSAVIYWANWSGDPEIHIVFARNFVRGMPLQFNPGEFSTGETSPAYMVLVAALVVALPLEWVPLGMKVIGVLSALGIAEQVRREAVRKLGGGAASCCVALAFLSMPLVWFQAWLGMENMLFACVMMPLASAMLRRSSDDWDAKNLSTVAFLLGLSTLLRPEAIFFAMALGAQLLMGRRILPALLFIAGCLALALGSVLLIQHFTGVPLHGAGLVRAHWSRIEALHLNLYGLPVVLHPKPLIILLFAWPALLLLVLVIRRHRALDGGLLALLSACVVLPVALQLFGFTPTMHSSRYLLPSYATLFMLIPSLIAALPASTRVPRVALVAGALLGFLAENAARYRAGLPGFLGDWSRVTSSLDPATKSALSDHLCRVASCGKAPVVIAAQEVQVRLLLDQRFIVRSLDGVVDHHLRKHIHDWGVDHLAYLRERGVELLLEFPDYNLEAERFSLKELWALGVGESRVVENLRFTRVGGRGPRVIRVER